MTSFKVHSAYINDNGKFVLLIRDYLRNPNKIIGWLMSYDYVLHFDKEPTEEEVKAAVVDYRLGRKTDRERRISFESKFDGRSFD